MRKGGGQPQIGNFINQRKSVSGSNSGGGTPDGIQCQVCHKVKSKDNYAKRQLQKYNPSNKAFARNPTSIKVTCITCTPGQTTELHCYICDTTYGLDKFAKNQRKDPDKARCMKCVNKVLETEPDMSPPTTDDENEEEDTDNEDWGNSSKKENARTASRASKSIQGSIAAPSSRFGSSLSTTTRDVAGSTAGSRSYAGSVTSSVATSNATPTSRLSPAQSRIAFPAPSTVSRTGGDVWETVGVAGAPVAKPAFSAWGAPTSTGSITENSSRVSRAVSRVAPSDTKSNGWAKVNKIPKGKEQKWGEGNVAEDGEDEWAKYGRDIRDAKAGKIPKKKKQADPNSDDDWN